MSEIAADSISDSPFRKVENGGLSIYVPNSFAYRLCMSIEQHMTERALVAWHLLPESERHRIAVNAMFGNVDTDAVRRKIASVVNLNEREVFFKRKK